MKYPILTDLLNYIMKCIISYFNLLEWSPFCTLYEIFSKDWKIKVHYKYKSAGLFFLKIIYRIRMEPIKEILSIIP